MLAIFRIRRVVCALSATFLILLLASIYRDEIRKAVHGWHSSWPGPRLVLNLNSPVDIFQVNEPPLSPHPIDYLLNHSTESWQALFTKRTHTLADAAAAYRRRRHRHPPPQFDKWFAYAKEHGCIIIEDFFDQIYRDIEPFWGVPAKTIRGSAFSLPQKISIRNGTASQSTDQWAFINDYFDMFRHIEQYLPDVDIPINVMDESRVLVPWEKVDELLLSSRRTQDLSRPPLLQAYTTIDDDQLSLDEEFTWSRHGPFWDTVKNGCPPDSHGRHATIDANFSSPPQFPNTWPHGSYLGYVWNWTFAKDPCIHAHLRNLHGSFVEPISISTSTKLLPMFSGSKLPMNNDILLPAAVYWHDEERFAIRNERLPWPMKRNEVLWRGSASGGRNRAENWTRFHRHRLLSMLNGTQIQMTLKLQGEMNHGVLNKSRDVPLNFPLPNQQLYPLQSSGLGLLPDWVRTLSNAAFTWLVCFPGTKYFGCSYNGHMYRQGLQMLFHHMFLAKYLPDVDGNSFSGRFRAFLQSNSVPIKATIYNEWHDDRLMPWMHFIPMDNTFIDLWAILEYLFSHDERAESIGSMGRHAAESVLRKEDMLAYSYRLILEYARVGDTRREDMGWAEDLR